MRVIVTPDPEAAERRALLADRAPSRLRRGLGRTRWPIATAVTVASFLAASAVIGLVVGEREQPWRISVLGQKLAHLRQHGAEYDTLFLGSSRVHYGLDPELFDGEMARLGCPARSFNMAVQALTINEEHRLVLELARIGRWERVFVERNPVPLRSLETIGTDRGRLAFGSLTAVRLAILDIWTSPGNPLERLRGIAEVALAGAHEQLGIGRVARLFPRPGADEIPTDDRVVDLGQRGFVPIEAETDPVMRARVAAIDRSRLEVFLEQTRQLSGPAPELGERRAALLREQVEHARQLASTVGYVIWPHSRPQWVADARAIGRAAEQGRLGDLLLVNLGDPERAPELYAAELWHDNLHLYTAGTEKVTRAIAAVACTTELARNAQLVPSR